MIKELVNKEALNINGAPMEAALKAYLTEKSPQNMAVLMEALKNARFLVPVEFPKKMSPELVEKLKKGEKVTPQELPKMFPILLKNKDDVHFAPAYTSKEQLPKEHHYMAIMPVPFADILRVSQVKEYKVKGIILNPNTDNFILSEKMIPLMDKVMKGEDISKVLSDAGIGNVQKQKITMTIDQFHVFARRNVEFGMLPKMAFQEKAKFIEQIDSEGEKMLLACYKSMYKANVAFPYEENDFDIMALQIRDDMTIVSLGFPSKHIGAGACSSGYVVWNPQTEELQYFAIEIAKDDAPSRLVQVLSDGKCQVLGEAPAPGSEMFAIIEMLDKQ